METTQSALEALEDLSQQGMSNIDLRMIFSVMKPFLIAAVIMIAGGILIKIASRMLLNALEKTKLDPVLFTFAVNCSRVILWIVVSLTAINSLGIPPTSILTVIGAAGVAIALALQNSLGNFAGGVLIIVTKPFSKGDYIDNLSVQGTVQHIDLLCTTLMTIDNKVITIPNGTLSNSIIVNYSRAENRRLDMVFTIGYEDDFEKAKDIVLTVAESSHRLLNEPQPFVGVGGHKDSAIAIDFKGWCRNADYWDFYYYMNEQVKLAFDEQGISIPYPQMDVHLDKTK